jgi:hypothetical protein
MASRTICCLIVALSALTLVVTLFGCIKQENFKNEQEVVLKATRLPPAEEGAEDIYAEDDDNVEYFSTYPDNNNVPEGMGMSSYASPLR